MKIAETFAGIFGRTSTGNKNGTRRNRTINRSVVRDFEIEDFAGVWYEIARFENGNENGLSHVTSTFTVDADGMITLRREGLRNGASSFEVTRSRVSVPDVKRQAAMKVSGMPFTDREINILEVDEDYNFALAGGRGANRLWILSRAPYIPQEDLGYLVARALERGYDISNLVFPDHVSVISTQEALAYAI